MLILKGLNLSNRNWNSNQYKQWRISVYQRDKFRCRWPSCRSNKKLNAHHILEWSTNPLLRFNVQNGITLCGKHHTMVTGKESHYSVFLSQLLERRTGKRGR